MVRTAAEEEARRDEVDAPQPNLFEPTVVSYETFREQRINVNDLAVNICRN